MKCTVLHTGGDSLGENKVTTHETVRRQHEMYSRGKKFFWDPQGEFTVSFGDTPYTHTSYCRNIIWTSSTKEVGRLSMPTVVGIRCSSSKNVYIRNTYTEMGNMLAPALGNVAYFLVPFADLPNNWLDPCFCLLL